jgi:hypothetical protein
MADSGVDLRLFSGHLKGQAASKKDTIRIDWATEVRNRTLRMGSRELYYQDCLRHAMSVDLAIVIQESKLVLNYLLVVLRSLGLVKVAYWGHGKSFKAGTASRFGESLKRVMSRNVDWWFAYNTKSKKIVEELGFPANRITVVDNAIDTRRLIELKRGISLLELDQMSLNSDSIQAMSVSMQAAYTRKRRSVFFWIPSSG